MDVGPATHLGPPKDRHGGAVGHRRHVSGSPTCQGDEPVTATRRVTGRGFERSTRAAHDPRRFARLLGHQGILLDLQAAIFAERAVCPIEHLAIRRVAHQLHPEPAGKAENVGTFDSALVKPTAVIRG